MLLLKELSMAIFAISVASPGAFGAAYPSNSRFPLHLLYPRGRSLPEHPESPYDSPPPPPVPPPMPAPGTFGSAHVPLPGSVLGVQQECVGHGAAGMCQPCQVSDQCSEGMTCCPEKKLCVKSSCDDCAEDGARCHGGCPDENVHSQYKHCKCENTRFPNDWAPQCGHLYDQDRSQYQFEQPKKNVYNQCYPRFETRFTEKCFHFEEEECTTGHEEKCENVKFQNCNKHASTNQDRKCVTVTEQICQFKKVHDYQEVRDTLHKVHCPEVKERICDTTQVMDKSTSDSFLCIDVPRYKCRTEIKKLYEESCKTSYRFECNFPSDGSGIGNGLLNHLYAEKRFAYNPAIPANWNLNEKFAGGNGGYGNDGGYGSNNPYGNGGDVTKGWQKYCTKRPINDCQKTPRTRHYEVCEQISEKECEKYTDEDPKPVEKEQCKFVTREKCEVKTQQERRQIDIPRFIKDCKPVEKELCGNKGKTELTTKCSTDVRPVCQFFPTERKCQKVPRQHCVQVPYQVKLTDCEENYDQSHGVPSPIGPGTDAYGRSIRYGRSAYRPRSPYFAIGKK